MNATHSPLDHDSYIIESFSKYVKTYDRHAQLQKNMAERLASLLPETSSETILELGCGTGVFTRHILARPFGALILNDIAPAMINHLKSRNEIPANTKVIAGNAEQMDFPPVDMIVANAVFQWFHNPKKTIRRLRSALNPGGRLIFSAFGPKTLKEFRQVGNIKSPINMPSFGQWKKLLGGLKIVESYSETRKVFFADALTLARNLQQIGAAPFRMTTTSELRKLIKNYDMAFSTSQGVYSTWELYYFSAIRTK